MSESERVWVRTCQECSHKQVSKPPSGPEMTSYLNAKCRRCKSTGLDYGSNSFFVVHGKIERINEEGEQA